MPRTTAAALAAAALAAASIALVGCASSDDRSAERRDAEPQPAGTSDARLPALGRQLDARKQQFLRDADPETARVYDEGVADVGASGVLETARRAGDPAPGFSLENARGSETSLDELLRDGPVVLTWYRGGWCPYCNFQLAAYQEALPMIRDRGASLVALTPEKPEFAAETVDTLDLGYEVLIDRRNRVAGAYGVAYRLPEPVIDQFKGRFDLPQRNTSANWSLPLAATYVIDQNGAIRYAYVTADYRTRAEPAEIVAALDEIRARPMIRPGM